MASLFRIIPEGLSAAPDARLIKAGDWGAFCLASDLLAGARREAERMGEEARAAFAAEKERGYAEGLEQSRLEHAEHMLETVLKSIDYIEGLEKGIVGIVGDALRKILGELPPEERIIGVVRQALTLVRGQKRVTLCVAPEDEAILRARLQEILGAYAAVDFVDVTADGRLSRGACLLQNEMGVIDASIETQIQALVHTLEKRQKG
jgi:type III secretion protein L